MVDGVSYTEEAACSIISVGRLTGVRADEGAGVDFCRFY
jgi:hypothetical protein